MMCKIYCVYFLVHTFAELRSGASVLVRPDLPGVAQLEMEDLEFPAVVLLQVEVKSLFSALSLKEKRWDSNSSDMSNVSNSSTSTDILSNYSLVGAAAMYQALMLATDQADAYIVMFLPLFMILVLLVAVITASATDDYERTAPDPRYVPARRQPISVHSSPLLVPGVAASSKIPAKEAQHTPAVLPSSRIFTSQRAVPHPPSGSQPPGTRYVHALPASTPVVVQTPCQQDPSPRRMPPVSPVSPPTDTSPAQHALTQAALIPHMAAGKVLCEQLVLPTSEAWFALPWLRFLHGPDFELIGISGRPLLRGAVTLFDSGHRCLDISMTPPKSPVLGSISNEAGAGALTVRDSEADLFGVLTFEDFGLWALKMKDGDLIHVQTNETTGEIWVRDSSSSETIAEAVRCLDSELFSIGDHLEVRLEPGADSVLVVICILGVILFGSSTPLPQALPLSTGSHRAFRNH